MVHADHMYARRAERAALTCGQFVPSLQGHVYMWYGSIIFGIISIFQNKEFLESLTES